MENAQDVPLLSVVVKCLNEEANIERCLRSLDAEIFGYGYHAEVILADSISDDRSVEIAHRFEVTIVQLANAADRRCGAAGHLGWQFVRGRFLLLIDGDMELLPGFLQPAFALMHEDERLGAVSGSLIEMSENIEYRERQMRSDPSRNPGLVDYVTGCALYRTAAIREAGHFMDRNLHCFEEFELGLRLRANNWRLRMLGVPCVRHYGHCGTSIKLLIQRWRTRFLLGYGELLVGAWGQTYFWQVLRRCRFALAVVLWWGVLLGLAAAAAFARGPYLVGVLLLLIAVIALPFIAMLVRKKSLERAAYAWLMQQFSAASLLAGLFVARTAPAAPLATIVLRDARTGMDGLGRDSLYRHLGAATGP